MVLIPFSIPAHIPKIKDGSKGQTTRTPRKPRKNGKPAYSVGELAHLYYKPRQTPTCHNCLNQLSGCYFNAYQHPPQDNKCLKWTNFFGESEIIDIIHYHNGDYKERYHEIWMGYTLKLADDEDRESWAIADGFANWDQACDWFGKNETNKTKWHEYWADQNLDVIVWNPKPIIARWQPK